MPNLNFNNFVVEKEKIINDLHFGKWRKRFLICFTLMQEASSYSTTFIEPQNLCRKQLTVRLNLPVLTIQSAMNIPISKVVVTSGFQLFQLSKWKWKCDFKFTKQSLNCYFNCFTLEFSFPILKSNQFRHFESKYLTTWESFSSNRIAN